MLRPLAGVLDLGDGAARDRVLQSIPTALPGNDIHVTDADPLVVGASGTHSGRDGVICIIDGAIYNREALAGELGLDAGEAAEAVLAAGYRRWGIELSTRLRGEFAALLWDRSRRRGLLIPDQFGIRRVFMRQDGRRLWFGSDVCRILALLSVRPSPDPVAVGHWLARSSPPGGATLYAGIAGVPWGHLLELGADGWAVRRYWQPRYEEPLQLSHDDLVAEVRVSLQRAVRCRLTPGTPTGILLSGGLDSTSVAALAQSVDGDGAIGFAATFPDYPDIDESRWLDALESYTGIETDRRATSGPGILASGLEYLLKWELPLHVWGDAWFQPLLQRASERGLATILGGDGGDELFGSRFYFTADLMRRGHFLSAARFARGFPEFGGRAPKRVFAELLWRFGVRGMSSRSKEAGWHRTTAPWWASDHFVRLLGDEPHSWQTIEGPRWWAFFVHCMTEAPHAFGLFDHVRRRSEQVGLEARHPLYDFDLCKLLGRVPPRVSSTGSLSRPLFREAMAGLSPDSVRLRPRKAAFDLIVAEALTGPERSVLQRLLTDDARVGDYVDRQAMHELLQGAGARGEGIGVWASHVIRLAGLEAWLRYQEDRSTPERLLRDPHLPAY